MEAEQYAQDIKAAFEISRQYDRRSKAVAKHKGKQSEKTSKTNTKTGGRGGVKRSNYENARAKALSFRAAYQYGYDPKKAMGG